MYYIGLKLFNWVKVDVGQAVDQSPSIFNNHALKAIAPEITAPVVAPVVKSCKASFDFTHKLRKT